MTGLPEGAAKPRLLYVSTLDHILGQMWPQMDAARTAGFIVESACQVTRGEENIRRHADAVHDLPLQRFPLHPANVVALARLLRLLRRRSYTIVHAHNPTGGFIGRLAATLAGVPARVYTVHGFHFHRQGGRLSNLIYRAVETFAGRFLSDAVIVVNGEDYEAAVKQRVVAPTRLFLTGGPGIDEAEFDPAQVSAETRRALRREVGAGEDTVVLTIVAEMIERKRHGDALAALAAVRAACPDVLLLLAGDGAREEALREQARSLGLSDICRFLGFRRDVASLLAATDIFLFPSAQEGLPHAVQEALCMEVPVIASAVRGNVDLVDASCGRLVPVGDPDALAEAIRELIALGPEERRRMGAAGRAKMIRQCSLTACVAQWQSVYRTVLSRKGVALAHETTEPTEPHAVAGTPP